MVQGLPSMSEALGLIPNSPPKKRNYAMELCYCTINLMESQERGRRENTKIVALVLNDVAG